MIVKVYDHCFRCEVKCPTITQRDGCDCGICNGKHTTITHSHKCICGMFYLKHTSLINGVFEAEIFVKVGEYYIHIFPDVSIMRIRGIGTTMDINRIDYTITSEDIEKLMVLQ